VQVVVAFAWSFIGVVGRLVAARNLGCTYKVDAEGTPIGCANSDFAFASMCVDYVLAWVEGGVSNATGGVRDSPS